MIILKKSRSPHQVRVLNPFTGLIVRFKAALPTIAWVREATMVTSPMMLFIISSEAGKIMWADQDSEKFQEFRVDYRNRSLSMTPFESKVYLSDHEGTIFSSTVAAAVTAEEHSSHRSAQTISMASTIRRPDAAGDPAWDCYLVKSEGELLLVTRPWYGVHGIVRRVDTESNKLELVTSIGNRALFLSDVRCLSVEASKFQGVEGGCIYFVYPVTTHNSRQSPGLTHDHFSRR